MPDFGRSKTIQEKRSKEQLLEGGEKEGEPDIFADEGQESKHETQN